MKSTTARGPDRSDNWVNQFARATGSANQLGAGVSLRGQHVWPAVASHADGGGVLLPRHRLRPDRRRAWPRRRLGQRHRRQAKSGTSDGNGLPRPSDLAHFVREPVLGRPYPQSVHALCWRGRGDRVDRAGLRQSVGEERPIPPRLAPARGCPTWTTFDGTWRPRRAVSKAFYPTGGCSASKCCSGCSTRSRRAFRRASRAGGYTARPSVVMRRSSGIRYAVTPQSAPRWERTRLGAAPNRREHALGRGPESHVHF